MLRVYSARIEPWDPARVEKLADAAGVALLLDVTRAGGGPGVIFAPSWELLRPALDARAAAKKLKAKDPEAAARIWSEAWTAYTAGYLDEMRTGYREHRDGWGELLDLESVVIMCRCADKGPPCDEGRCHRHLLRRYILPMLGACNAGELGVDYPAYRVAVTGTRPPKPGAGHEERRIYDHLAVDCRGTILGLDLGAIVVHGDAEGIDSVARDAARARGLVEEAHLPKPEEHGGSMRDALLARNSYVTTVERALAWPSPWSRGTWHAVGLAEKAGVKVERCWERVWQRSNVG